MNELTLYGSAIALLLGSSLLPLLHPAKRIRQLSIIFAMAAHILFILLSGLVLFSGETMFWQASFGLFPFSVTIDSLAAIFILLTAVVSFCTAIYSFSYVEYIQERKDLFLFFTGLFVLSFVLVISSSTLIAFLFFWECMSLTSLLLVMTEYHNKETRRAGIFYFVMTQLSTVFLLLAFILIYQYTGSLTIGGIDISQSSLANVIFAALFLGFGTKAGVIPFHKWLPYAHPASPSPISALMSGVMIKIAIYGLLRFLFLFSAPLLWWGITILVFGTISAFLGVIYALREHDIKRLLAYHSIENIGIILMGIGLYVIFRVFALDALAALSLASGLFHTLNHALFKSLLFLSAGAVVHATHTKNMEEMGGLIKKMPCTASLFLIGAVSISALPPFNGFVSELMLFEAFFQSGVVPSILVKILLLLSVSLLAMTSALAAACFVKAFGVVFLAMPRSKEAGDAKEAPFPMIIGPALLAFLCAALGIFSYPMFSAIGMGAGYSFPLPNLLWITVGGGILALVVFCLVFMVASRKTRVVETWGCGILSQNPKMEYTASGFSEPIITIFSSIYRPKRIQERTFFDAGKAVFKESHVEISLVKFFEEYLYLPFVRIAEKISAFLYIHQNKVELDSYILFSFIIIILLVIIAGGLA